ncbi:MAG: hypothetical protein ACMXX7_00195 [Candidatus Woesearchaeota archaeon]
MSESFLNNLKAFEAYRNPFMDVDKSTLETNPKTLIFRHALDYDVHTKEIIPFMRTLSNLNSSLYNLSELNTFKTLKEQYPHDDFPDLVDFSFTLFGAGGFLLFGSGAVASLIGDHSFINPATLAGGTLMGLKGLNFGYRMFEEAANHRSYIKELDNNANNLGGFLEDFSVYNKKRDELIKKGEFDEFEVECLDNSIFKKASLDLKNDFFKRPYTLVALKYLENKQKPDFLLFD